MRRYHRPVDQQRFLTAWALARLILSEALGVAPDAVNIVRSCPRCGADHGKPQIHDEGWQLSLSHAGERVFVAVSAQVPVGVDVERVPAEPEITDRLAGVVLHKLETPAGDPAALLRYWVRKEAVLKATGHGLLMPMAALAVTPPGDDARLLDYPDDLAPAGRVAVRDLPIAPPYLAAVALVLAPDAGDDAVSLRLRDGDGVLAGAVADPAQRDRPR